MTNRTQSETVIGQPYIIGGQDFHFYESHLEYQGKNWGFRVKYNEMAGPSSYRRRKTTDRAPRIAAGFLCLLALLLLRNDPTSHIGDAGFQWFLYTGGVFVGVVIAICVPLYCLTHKEFTVIPTDRGEVLVIQNKQHDMIVQKLKTARLESLRKLSAPDLANSPKEELHKLKWLLREGAISNEEYLNLSVRQASAS